MANRMFRSSGHRSFLGMPVDVYAKTAIGASGASTISAANSKGVTSITRGASVGKYTVVIADPYAAFLGMTYNVVLAAGSPGSYSVVIRSIDAQNQTFVIEFLDGSGAAAELASGATLYLKFELNRSSV